MTPRRLTFVIGFCWTVAAAGLLVFALALRQEGVAACAGMAFAVLLVGVVLGELVPLRLPLRGGEEETNLSTPFAFAILLSGGLAPALIAQSAASVIQDLVARKPLWRSAFNIGQYVLCLASAEAVLRAFGRPPGGTEFLPSFRDITADVLAGAAFFTANFLIVGMAVARYQGIPLRTYLRNDLRTTTLMAGVSISLAPLMLAVLDESPLLLALFVLPFIAVHRSGRLACESAHQALHDALTGLPNRAHFRQLVEDAIAGAEGGGRFAVPAIISRDHSTASPLSSQASARSGC
jgi:hypothetical protein